MFLHTNLPQAISTRSPPSFDESTAGSKLEERSGEPTRDAASSLFMQTLGFSGMGGGGRGQGSTYAKAVAAEVLKSQDVGHLRDCVKRVSSARGCACLRVCVFSAVHRNSAARTRTTLSAHPCARTCERRCACVFRFG
eukprot:3299613-Pleurochrysis_carterae.AAC.1